jgi:hypothetical protein
MGSELYTYQPGQAPRQVLDLASRLVPQLLSGAHPQLAVLRAQYEQARVSRVESSGVGFLVSYEVPAELAAAVPSDFAGGDARISVAGMESPAGCVLFVRGGRLALLETYTHDGSRWPADAEVLDVDEAFPLLVPGS